MADSSFDVVSKIDRMELDNAINQAIREIDTRFDFKNTGAKIELTGDKLAIEAGTEERAKAALDVVKDKMIKRGVSLKHLETADPQLSGKIYKIAGTLKEGISTENAKKIAKFLRDEGPNQLRLRFKVTNYASHQRAAMISKKQLSRLRTVNLSLLSNLLTSAKW